VYAGLPSVDLSDSEIRFLSSETRCDLEALQVDDLGVHEKDFLYFQRRNDREQFPQGKSKGSSFPVVDLRCGPIFDDCQWNTHPTSLLFQLILLFYDVSVDCS